MSQWYDKDQKVIGKILIAGKLKSISPILIGSGGLDNCDIDCLKYSDGTAYIPGSSLAGVLKSKFCEYKVDKKIKEYLWGTEDTKESQDKSIQSHLIIEDAKSSAKDFRINDGIKINYDTNQTKEGSKYDYETIEPGGEFQFNLELTIREIASEHIGSLQKSIKTLLDIMSKDFQVGAKTNSGFGEMVLIESKTLHFDFKKPQSGEDWFTYLMRDSLDESRILVPAGSWDSLPKEDKDIFTIEADFSIKSSLITATYGEGASEPDSVQMSRNNIPYVSGTSIKGAIRHRALKIINTINPAGVNKKHDPEFTENENSINNLFGFVRETKLSEQEKQNLNLENVQKSRIGVKESVIENYDMRNSITQTRIKIDRFTGGTIEGALMETRPIWKKDEQKVNIRMSIIDPKPNEIPLLLMVLKDLWTSDLAIGGDKGIGRGILIGEAAEIKLPDGNVVSLKNGIPIISTEDYEKIKPYNNLKMEAYGGV